MDTYMVLFLVGAFVANALVFGGISWVYFADKHRGDKANAPVKTPAQLLSKAKAPVPPSRRLPAARDRDRFRAAYAGP